MPIVLMTILGFSLSNMFSDNESSIGSINVAVVKKYDIEEDIERFQDTMKNGIFAKGMDEKSQESLISVGDDFNVEDIFFEFLNSDGVKKLMSYSIEDELSAEAMIKEKQVDAVIVLPENYIFNTYMNYIFPARNIVDIKVIKHTDSYIKGSVAEEIVNGFSETMNNYCLDKEVFTNQVQKLSSMETAYEGIEYLMEQLTDEVSDNHSIERITVEGKKNITSFQYYAVAMMAMFILYSASNGGRLLLEEKDNITYQRNRVAGVPLSKIMVSNFCMIFIISMLQSLVMILYSSLILNIDWGDYGLVILTVLSSSLAIGGIGIFISTITLIVGNYKFANVFELGIIQFLALLGGSFVPVETLPSFMNNLSYLSTSGVAIKIYTGIMRNKKLIDMLGNYAILIGTGVIFIFISAIVMNTRREAI